MTASMPYCGAPPGVEAWRAPNLDPVLLALLGLMLAATLLIRGDRRPAWGAGWACLVLAFVSPLCALTADLLSARAVHHLLLVTVAAPLIALAFVGRGFGGDARRIPPTVGLSLLALALVLWHLPVVYRLAWESHAVYWAMQVALLAPAVAFWAGLFARASHEPFEAAAHLAALAAVMGLIGAVLTFAPRVLYPQHGLASLAYGLDPLKDQQLAGLLMWAPGLLPLAVIGALLLRSAWARTRTREGAA